MKILIAYYSRTGNTKNIAERITRELERRGVDDIAQEEIREVGDNRRGMLGYLKAGKDAMGGRSSVIAVPENPVENFDMLLIGSPVWAWNLSPPVRTYCNEYGRKSGKVAFFCTMGGSGDKKLFSEMEKSTDRKPASVLSLSMKEMKNDEVCLEKVRTFVAYLPGVEEL